MSPLRQQHNHSFIQKATPPFMRTATISSIALIALFTASACSDDTDSSSSSSTTDASSSSTSGAGGAGGAATVPTVKEICDHDCPLLVSCFFTGTLTEEACSSTCETDLADCDDSELTAMQACGAALSSCSDTWWDCQSACVDSAPPKP